MEVRPLGEFENRYTCTLCLSLDAAPRANRRVWVYQNVLSHICAVWSLYSHPLACCSLRLQNSPTISIPNMASLLTNAQNAYSKKDSSTMSNAASVRCLSVHLEWRLDFVNSQIHGSATHAMEVLVAGTETALFDSRVLTIKGVEIDGKATSFTVGDENVALGSCITVAIPTNLRAQGSKFQVSFQYSTSKEAPAIQW